MDTFTQAFQIHDPTDSIIYCMKKIKQELTCSIWECLLQALRHKTQCPLCKTPVTKRACNDDASMQELIEKYNVLLETFEHFHGPCITTLAYIIVSQQNINKNRLGEPHNTLQSPSQLKIPTLSIIDDHDKFFDD